MIRDLKALQKKLTNLNGNNKSILQQRFSSSQDFDLHILDFLNSVPSFDVIDFLFSNKKVYDLCEVNDSRNASVNEASKKLKKIQRQTHFLLEERGVKELYIGWPFVVGKFKNNSSTRCPLLFFPVNLSQKNGFWRIEKRTDESVCFNKSFLLAYSYFNETPLEEAFIESVFEDYNDSQIFRNELYTILKSSPIDINFSADIFENRLRNTVNYKKGEFENHYKAGILKLENTANLGIYPQSGSYLMPDYDYWISKNEFSTFEDFFLSKNQISTDKHRQLSSVKEEQTFTPFQIDASQEAALKAVKQGNSLVVQGPPGTGKSQLICNLIADYIARGKNILVVSQKRAALDVVHKRLQEKELGDFVSVVHDFKNDRKHTYSQIENQINNLEKYRQLNNGLDTIYLEREYLHACRRIDQLTESFEEFKQALFDTKECGLSVKELYVTSSPLKPHFSVTQEYRVFDRHKLSEFNDKLDWLFPYAKLFDANDFYFSDRLDFSKFTTSDLPKILNILKNIPLYQEDFSKKTNSLIGHQLSVEESKWILDREGSIKDLIEIVSADKVYSFFKKFLKTSTDKDWLYIKEKQILACYENEGIVKNIKSEELATIQKALSGYSKSRKNIFSRLKWHLVSKDKYAIKRLLISNDLGWNKSDIKLLINKVDNRLNLEHLLTSLKECKWLADAPRSTDQSAIQLWFDEVIGALEAKCIAEELRSFVQYLPLERYTTIALKNAVIEVLNWCRVVATQLEMWHIYLSKTQIGKLLNTPTLSIAWSETLSEHFENLCLYDKALKELTNEEKKILDKLVEVATDTQSGQDIFQNSLRIAWIEHIEAKHPMLKTVSTLKFEKEEKELQNCIKKKLALSNDILLLKAREQTYKEIEYNRLNNRTTYRELEHQVSKKRKIWPVRKTISTFKDELFNLIPCWLASPESVSAIFSMDMKFDLVIFDEASQCFAEKGLPAIYRAKQVVITGDKHQLAPNDLYQVRFEEDEEISSDLEIDSLLDLSTKYFLQTQLTGHYRSESLDLIDFSNSHFYNNTLQLIPHFDQINTNKPGILFKKIDGLWENGVNEIEAIAVVEYLFELVKSGETSLGIVTFNYKQQNLILDLIDERLLEDQIILPNAVFVKNIENVQGDEREVILFSIGYAVNKAGKVNANFGSLNFEKGENRLNVAITRAKKRIILFSSILPHQLQVDETKHIGPKLFKKYLNYAYAVSEGNFIPQLVPNLVQASDWYLNSNIQGLLTEYFKAENNLPFADVTLKKEGRIIGTIHTDDNFYYTLGVKEYHAYKQLRMTTLEWKFTSIYSRNYWVDKSKVQEKLVQFFSV